MNGTPIERQDGRRYVALKAGLLYFALVMATGFALGFVRVLWVAPRLGEKTAELLEMPLMLLVTVIAARWTVRRLSVPPTPAARLTMGLVALALLLAAEVAVVVVVSGVSLADYVASRDPVSGTAYLVSLAVFAAAPLLVRSWDR